MNQPGTRDRLLRHARKLFATEGFRGTSVRAVTAAARANLGAVTYHFGSKQRLYEAVLGQVIGDLADRVTKAAAGKGTSRERLAAVVHALFAFFGDNPDAPRLMLRQVLRRETAPRPALVHMRRVLDAVTTIVRDGQAARELRPVEPFLAAFTLISQCVWFAVARHNIAAVSGVPLDQQEMANVVERHIADAVTLAFGQPSPRDAS